MAEGEKITVIKLADICGPCVFGKHDECKRIDCTCNNNADAPL
jgi:hypothetical protein